MILHALNAFRILFFSRVTRAASIPPLAGVLGLLIVCSVALAQSDAPEASSEEEDPPDFRLGERLFRDDRFSSAQGDMRHSCRTCHMIDEDPEFFHVYTDPLSRSWVPYRSQDRRRTELRNSQSLLDVGTTARLHHDGEFPSLEALIKGTYSGRNMGWLPGEEDQAFDLLYAILLSDDAQGVGAEGTYREHFRNVYDIDIEAVGRTETVGYVARAVEAYVLGLESTRSSPYDQFVAMNGLDEGPAEGEDVKVFARRHLARVSALEAESNLNLPEDFGARALLGYKIFFRTGGAESAGNCIACHVPPDFTDKAFHNTGISQDEYDRVHGGGSFAALEIPGPGEAVRPSPQFRDFTTRGNPGHADLGHWNFVDLDDPSVRREGETASQLLDRMIGAFKTPTVRNLAFSRPYMHNGEFVRLSSAMQTIIRGGELARDGRLRSADVELLTMNITGDDVAPLIAFFNTLNEDYE